MCVLLILAAGEAAHTFVSPSRFVCQGVGREPAAALVSAALFPPPL